MSKILQMSVKAKIVAQERFQYEITRETLTLRNERKINKFPNIP